MEDGIQENAVVSLDILSGFYYIRKERPEKSDDRDMEQVADKETCSMEYKKGWEEEEYIFCTFRED